MVTETRSRENKSATKRDETASSSDLKRKTLGNKVNPPEHSDSFVETEDIINPVIPAPQPPLDESSGYLTITLSLVIIAIVIAAVLLVYNPELMNKNAINEKLETPSEIFARLFPEFKENFPDIPEISLLTIKYVTTSVLDHDDPRSPAAILILGTEGRKAYTEKVLQSLMGILSKTFDKKIDSERQYLNFEEEDLSDPSELKLKITNKIKQAFEKHSFMSIQNIDKAPWNVVSILHPYFDHENAPFKRVVYLCSATTSDKLSVAPSLKAFRQLAEHHFDTTWEKYHTDHRDAMYARIFTGLAVV